MKLNWKGVAGFLTSIAGVLSAPEVLHVLPPKYATALTVTGVLVQSVTRPMHDGETVTSKPQE